MARSAESSRELTGEQGDPCRILCCRPIRLISTRLPKLVVPISYKLPGLTLLAQNLEGVEKFAKEMGATDLTPQPKLQISVTPSVDETKLVILEPRGATASAAVD